jgi:hypothetical protein
VSIARGLVIIVVCGACFGVIGGLLGFALGVGAPAYYRGVFSTGNEPGFNPVQVGLGLGLTQGLISGAVIGSVVVLAASRSRPLRQSDKPTGLSDDQIDSSRRRTPIVRRALALIAVLVAIACSGVVGAVVGQLQLYQQSTNAKLDKIRPVLLEPAFADVSAEYSSAAQVYLRGQVDSERAYKALEEKMRFLFGDEEGRSMMSNVEVVSPRKIHHKGTKTQSKFQKSQ